MIDSAGNKIPNLFRDKSGSISVIDKNTLNKYLIEQTNQLRLNTLENDLKEIKNLLKELLKHG